MAGDERARRRGGDAVRRAREDASAGTTTGARRGRIPSGSEARQGTAAPPPAPAVEDVSPQDADYWGHYLYKLSDELLTSHGPRAPRQGPARLVYEKDIPYIGVPAAKIARQTLGVADMNPWLQLGLLLLPNAFEVLRENWSRLAPAFGRFRFGGIGRRPGGPAPGGAPAQPSAAPYGPADGTGGGVRPVGVREDAPGEAEVVGALVAPPGD